MRSWLVERDHPNQIRYPSLTKAANSDSFFWIFAGFEKKNGISDQSYRRIELGMISFNLLCLKCKEIIPR